MSGLTIHFEKLNMNIDHVDDVVVKSRDYLEDIYEEWTEAIRSDDETTVSTVFANCSFADKRVLLNPKLGPRSNRPQGKVKICNGSINEEQVSEFEIDCPWILACCYGSNKVLKILYEENADVFYKDNQGNNCLHSIVKLCALHGNMEVSMVSTYQYLLDLLTSEEIRKLLMDENHRLMRPLEEAMFYEIFSLFEVMFYTKNVYLVKEIRCGIQTVQYFDVTEYECIEPGNRNDRSPLRFITLLTKEKFHTNEAKATVLSDPMKTWYVTKKKTFTPLIYLWALFRIIYLSLYFYTENLLSSSISLGMSSKKEPRINQMNITLKATSGPTLVLSSFEESVTIITMCISGCTMAFDVLQFIVLLIHRPPWKLGILNLKQNTIVQYRYYRAVQFTVSILTLVLSIFIIILAYPQSTINIDIMVLQVLYSFVVASCIWAIMFFLQLIPWLGHFVVAVQRMLGDLAKFFIIYCLFMVPYVMTFYWTLRRLPDSQFSTLGDAIYSTFLTMLNMINYSNYQTGTVTVTIYMMHITYVFMISILLINFLIAMFSSSYAEVTQNRDIIFVIQSLSVCLALENRLRGPLKNAIRFFKKRYFVYEDGHYYITKVFISHKSKSCIT